LFPRHTANAPSVIREARVLKALESVAPPFVPRLNGVWQDPEIYPHTFISTGRMPGRDFLPLLPGLNFEELSAFLGRAGRLIGAMHNLRLGDFDLPPVERVSNDAWVTGKDALRSPEALEGWIERAAAAVGPHLGDIQASLRDSWMAALAPLAGLDDVLVHGDVCENQFLVREDSLEITALLDWGRATVGNPLKDFDFGEWGIGLFEWEPRFEELRRAMWESYREVRRGNLPGYGAPHLFFTLFEAAEMARLRNSGGPMTAWQRRRFERSMHNLRRASPS